MSIDDCAEIVNGFAFKSEFFTEERKGLPLVRIRDILLGRSGTSYTGEYPDSALVRNGDLLIGMDGEFNIAKWKGGKALLNQRVCKVVAKEAVADLEYLKYALTIILKRIEDRTPFVTVKHLSSEDLKEEPVWIPALSDQRRIAVQLDQADRLRRTRRYTLELTDSFLPAAFLEVFGEPVGRNAKWGIQRLEELCEEPNGIKAGPFGSSLKKEFYAKSGIRIYGQEQVIAGDFSIGDYYISEEMFSDFEAYEVRPGDVLISLVGTFGKVIVVPDKIERGIINPRLLKLSPKKDQIDSTFLAKLIEHPATQYELLRMSHGGTMGILNAGLLRDLRIIVPPQPLQKKLVSIVTRHEHLRSIQHESLRQADHLFQSLLHEAFSPQLN